MRPLRPVLSLRVSLFLPVLLLAATSVALIVHIGVREYRQNVQLAEQDTQRLAGEISSDFKVLVNAAQELGETLSLLPDVASRNPARIEPLLAKLLELSPVYANIVLLDREGRAWASGVPMKGRVFSMADRRYFIDAMATGRFSAGEYTKGKTTGIPVLTFGYPLKGREGRPSGCIAIGFNLEYFKNAFAGSTLPEGFVFSFFDHRGTILFRSFLPERYAGKALPLEMLASLRAGPDRGTDLGPGLDGVRKIRSHVTLRLRDREPPYLFVRVTAPFDPVVSRIRTVLFGDISVLACLVLPWVLLAWYIGRRFVAGPVAALKEAILRVGSGDLAPRARDRIPLRELEEVAKAFDAMVARLSESLAEREDLRAHLRQAQKMEAIGTLAGGIAHDFNNILTPIMAHGELALMQLPEGDPVRDDISELLAAAERAALLVKQILAISRKEDAGVPVSVNVGALVKETAKFLRASIPSTIELRIDLDPACGPVLAEPTRLHQVILNLCTNASYAMAEKGGALTLSLKREEGVLGRRVRLTVSDTGPGIPAEVQARIFEPYFTTKPTGKGSGLGLAVVHGIVTTLGGEIRVRSEPGQGATFDVWLPETERVATPRHVMVGEVVRGSGQRVLAVDDEQAIRTVLERLLRSLGYEVTVCGSGPEALEVFWANPEKFDVVLSDYTMPGMTGIALAEELLALRPDLPIVLGTGFSEGVDEASAKAAGLRGPVMKPYSAQKLGAALRGALEEAGKAVGDVA